MQLRNQILIISLLVLLAGCRSQSGNSLDYQMAGPANYNKALHLDGKNNNVCFGMGILEAPWTLEMWFKGNDNSWKETEVLFGGGEYSTFKGIDNLPLVIKDGKLHSTLADLWSDSAMDDKWHHAAVTSDGSSTALYLDGKVIDSKPVSYPILVGSLGILEEQETAFSGLIDEVRIWSSSLSEETINNWKNKPIGNNHPFFTALKGYYNFDEELEESAVNWVGKGHQAYHIRNGRINYKDLFPLAYTVTNDNPYFSVPSQKQEVFNAVVIDSEWDVDQGAIGDPVLKLRIIISGEEDPLFLNELELDLTNTTNLTDIVSLHVFDSGKKANSNHKKELFKTDISPQSHLVLKGEQFQLTPGVNYILITADISANSRPGNIIKINIPSFTLNGKKYVPETCIGLNDKTITRNSLNNEDVFRVLDWNIWHGGNHLGNVGVDRVIELIRKTGADIITMQEAYGSQMKIAQALNFQMQTHSPKDNLALFSRYPLQVITPTEPFKSNPVILKLPRERELLVNSCWLRYAYNPEYTASFPQQGYDTNLWIAEDSIRPMEDVSVIIRKDIDPYVTNDVPVIIAGDFNSFSHLDWTKAAAPLHYGYGPVNFPTSRLMIENGYKDSFREMHPDEVSRPEGTFAAIYGHLQTSRIDFIYYTPGKIRSVSSKIIRTTPEIDDVWPSDHAAVLTTFEFTK